MIGVVIQTIQLLGRRIILKIGLLSGALMFSGLFQIIPILFLLPIIRIIARPNKQFDGLPKRMRRLMPEDWANSLDQLITTTDTKTLIVYVVSSALILFIIQAVITNRIKKYLTYFLNQQSYTLANKLFNNYLETDTFSYANPINQIQSGCNALTTILDNTINALFSVAMFLMIASILIFIYPLPGFTTVAVIVISICLLTFVISPKMERIIATAQQSIFRSRHSLSDSMTAIKEIKLMGRERFFFNAYLQGQEENQNLQKTKERFQTLSNAITMISRYAGLVAGIGLALYTLPKEEFAGFVMIFMMLSMKTYAYAQALVAKSSQVQNALLVLNLHYKTMLRYDEKSTDSDSDDSAIVLKESIEFKNMSFRHQDTKDEEIENYEVMVAAQEEEEEEKTTLPLILENINFKIKRGQFIGLVGRNGSGKSTILDLFSGLHIPTQGHILIDGKKLTVSGRKNWRKQINYVIQKPHIISQSILYNVTLGLSEEEIDQQLLQKVMEISVLDQVIKQLPKGLKTEVGMRGTKISGGQAQRIALARSLYQDRPVLLLDEATRAIDAATEAEIMENISTMRGKKTIIIVTHRVQSLRQCDNIFVIDDKKIAAEGDYETLCETNELFKLFALGKVSERKIEKQKKIPSVA